MCSSDLFNISGGPRLSLNEVNQAAKLIYSNVEADANVIFGALVDETLGDNISITVLATGFSENGFLNEGRVGQAQPVGRMGSAVNNMPPPPPTPMNHYGRNELNDVIRRDEPAARPSPPPPQPRQDPPPPRRSGGGDKVPSFLKNLKRR